MTLSTPTDVQERLEGLDTELQTLQNTVELAAWEWFKAKRQREKARASAFLTAKGSIAARWAVADLETAEQGMEEEGTWEGKRALQKALETRAMVGSAILKAQGRA